MPGLYQPNLTASSWLPVQILKAGFTSDGVVVGVVIRSVERYDLVKIKPTESEGEHLNDSAYDAVAYDQVKTALSKSQCKQKRKNKPMTIFRFRALRWIGSSASASDSENLVFTGS